MAECFNGVSSQNVEKFFLCAVLSDMNLPHTPDAFSPITFTDYLARNQIITVNPYPIYENLNSFWKKFYASNIELVTSNPTPDHALLAKADEKQPSWNLLIDYLRRVLLLDQFTSTYYKMHYIAHVCKNFYKATEEYTDLRYKSALRAIYNKIMEPVLYDVLIPTQYAWLPVKSYTDIGFDQGVANATRKAWAFVEAHTIRTPAQFKRLDKTRVDLFRKEIDECLSAVVKVRYQSDQVWSVPFVKFLDNCYIYRVDLDLCDMASTFKRDGMQCLRLFDAAAKIRKRYDNGVYRDDSESAIDALLDIRPTKKFSLKDTVVKKIKSVIKHDEEDVNQ